MENIISKTFANKYILLFHSSKFDRTFALSQRGAPGELRLYPLNLGG